MKFISLFLFVCISYSASVHCFFDYHRAVSTYNSQDYAQALEQFEALLTENPNDGQLNYNAGKSAYQQQEYQAAASYFTEATKAKEIEPSLAMQASFDLGNTYIKQKKWQEALESYEKVLTFEPEHAQAKDMIEKIKKLLEQQQQQQQNQNQQQDQNQDQDQQNDQDSNQEDNQSQDKEQNKQDKKSNDKNKQNQQNKKSDDKQSQDNQDSSSDNEQDQNQQDGSSSDQKDKQSKGGKKQQDNKQKDDKQDPNAPDANNDDSKSDKNEQDGESSQNGGNKQDLNDKNTKKSGEEVGEKSKSEKADKDFQQDGRDDLENSIPDIQDHERKDSGFDHSASPNQKQSNSTKQDTPVSAKAQGAKLDPFAIDDGIDKESREGKILQFIEARDAQAAQQLLKMNVQTQRKPGEKNW